jgi:hypothetical protein
MQILVLVLTVLGPLVVWYAASLMDSSEHERWLRALRALRELEPQPDRRDGGRPGSDRPDRMQQVADGNEPGRIWRLLPERID